MSKEKPEMTEEQEEHLRKNPINVFTCMACENSKGMVFEEFKHHLFTVHNLKHDQLKGKKQMRMHMDGAQWYSYNYEWTLDTGLKFAQYIEMARDKDDPMRFEY